MMGSDFKMDVARWLVPGEIGDVEHVTLGRAARLVYRHMGLRAMLAVRIGKWCKRTGVPGAPSFVQRLIYRRYGLDIVIGAPMGGGLYFAHPIGTTFAPASAGENCSVIAAVTVGMRNERAFPVLGDRVFLGAGARGARWHRAGRRREGRRQRGGHRRRPLRVLGRRNPGSTHRRDTTPRPSKIAHRAAGVFTPVVVPSATVFWARGGN